MTFAVRTSLASKLRTQYSRITEQRVQHHIVGLPQPSGNPQQDCLARITLEYRAGGSGEDASLFFFLFVNKTN